MGTFIIKNAGHWVQQEKPVEVNKIISDFLKKLA
jgi:pimeloyl-ACP methyl ester carboxylesterase